MNAPAPGAGRPRWIALAALVVLAAGLFVASRQWRPAQIPAPQGSAPPDEPVPGPEPGDRAIDEALRQAPPGTGARAVADSAASQRRWVEEVQGVDVSGLDPARLELFVRFANARSCTCGCGYTLAACRSYDATCETSPPLLESLRDSIRAGRISGARGIRERPGPGG